MNAQARFDEIVDDVLARYGDVERTQMMGMPSLKRNGKLVAGLWKQTMAFKLPTRPSVRRRWHSRARRSSTPANVGDRSRSG